MEYMCEIYGTGILQREFRTESNELTAYKIAEYLESRSKSMEQTLDYSFVSGTVRFQ